MSGWALMIASIVLQALYSGHSADIAVLTTYGPTLTMVDLALLFVSSVFAGLVLVDVEWVVTSCFGALGISSFIMFLCLTLPITLGIIANPILKQYLVEGALILIIRSLVPSGIITCLMGGLSGGILGEMLAIHDSTIT